MATGLMPDGSYAEVPGDLFNIVEEISWRWPRLKVQFLNPEQAEVTDAPYRIIEMTPNGPMFVCDVWELDQRLIDRLHMMNAANVDVVKEIDKANAALKKERSAQFEESKGEAADLLKSGLDHFHKGKLEFKYTNDQGQKRIVTDRGAKDKEIKVL